MTTTRLLVSWYLTSRSGSDGPTFIVDRGDDSILYDTFSADFERVWNSATSEPVGDFGSSIREIEEGDVPFDVEIRRRLR
ncbi:MAG: hypothetical protein HYS05_13530 [Acidobacteria bacterium]|nr:hypothetical protein [Acidobacteriota bacterium]